MKKKFHITIMFGDEEISWSSSNFNEEEIDTIERFLGELNEHANSVTSDFIAMPGND